MLETRGPERYHTSCRARDARPRALPYARAAGTGTVQRHARAHAVRACAYGLMRRMCARMRSWPDCAAVVLLPYFAARGCQRANRHLCLWHTCHAAAPPPISTLHLPAQRVYTLSGTSSRQVARRDPPPHTAGELVTRRDPSTRVPGAVRHAGCTKSYFGHTSSYFGHRFYSNTRSSISDLGSIRTHAVLFLTSVLVRTHAFFFGPRRRRVCYAGFKTTATGHYYE